MKVYVGFGAVTFCFVVSAIVYNKIVKKSVQGALCASEVYRSHNEFLNC